MQAGSSRRASVQTVMLVCLLVVLTACAPGTRKLSAPERAAIQAVAVQCAAASDASGALPMTVGMADASERRSRLMQLEHALRGALTKVNAVLRRMPEGATKRKATEVTFALRGYANAVEHYRTAVPIATTSIDSSTVVAFGRLLHEGALLDKDCARLIGD